MNETKRIIKAYAALNGLTQEDLATALGIKREAFNRKLNGHSEFYDKEKEIIANLFGLKITDIFFRNSKHKLCIKD